MSYSRLFFWKLRLPIRWRTTVPRPISNKNQFSRANFRAKTNSEKIWEKFYLDFSWQSKGNYLLDHGRHKSLQVTFHTWVIRKNLKPVLLCLTRTVAAIKTKKTGLLLKPELCHFNLNASRYLNQLLYQLHTIRRAVM